VGRVLSEFSLTDPLGRFPGSRTLHHCRLGRYSISNYGFMT
jgi:hypothetical protein